MSQFWVCSLIHLQQSSWYQFQHGALSMFPNQMFEAANIGKIADKPQTHKTSRQPVAALSRPPVQSEEVTKSKLRYTEKMGCGENKDRDNREGDKFWMERKGYGKNWRWRY